MLGILLLHCSGSSYFIFLPASHRKSWFEYFGWYFVCPFFIFLPVCLQLQARQSQYHQGLPVQWKKKPTVCRVNVSSASCLTAMKYRTNSKGWSLKFTSFFAPITTSLILLYFMFKRFRCLCATSSTQPERLVRYFQNKTQKKVVFLIFGLFLFCFLAGISRLHAAPVNYHARLHPETAKLLIAAFDLHAQKPQCPTAAVTAAGSTAATMQPERWVRPTTYEK